MFAASKTAGAVSAAPPASSDPQFNYVSLLLNDTGTNGQQNNTFLDSSSNNFTITRNGTPTQGSVTPYWPDGQWSNFFNSTTVDYLGVPSNTALNPSNGAFTFETWFYPLTFTQGSLGGDTLFIVEATNGVQIGKRETPGGNVWGLCANGIAWRLTTSTQPTNNAWNHIVIVRSGTGTNQTSIFLNGVRVANGTVSDTFAQGAAYVGGGTSTGAQKINGYLSNLRFIKGTAVYDPTQATLTVPTTPLTAVSGTSLLTCQSNRFKDNSSNNFAITVTGTPSVQAFEPFEPASSYATSVGGSGYFNGSSSLALNSADLTLTGDFTFEGWLFFDPATTGDFIFCIGNEASGRFLLGVNAGGTLVYDLFGLGTTSFGGTFPKGSWNYFTFVRSGSTMTAYINGVSTGTTRTLSGTRGNSSGAYVWGASTGSRTTTGYLSNMRLIRGTALYTSNFTPPTSPVTAITGTSLLLNFTNAGIYDAATLNDLVTVGDAKVSTAQAKFGSSSMAFDGTGDWLTAPANTLFNFGTGNFTVETWVYITSNSPAEQFLYGKRANNAAYAPLLVGISKSGTVYRSYYLGSFTGASWGLNSSFAKGTIDIPLNTWVHLAVVRNGSTFTSYVNGVADLTFTGLSSALMTNTDGVTIGADATSGSSPWFGYLDDLRITKGYARYTANFTPPTAPFPTR